LLLLVQFILQLLVPEFETSELSLQFRIIATFPRALNIALHSFVFRSDFFKFELQGVVQIFCLGDLVF
jgi:hypothetical protein